MKIYVINLKESVERREQVRKVLSSVDFEFFDAENIKKDPDHFIYTLYDEKKTRKYKGYTLTVPELGCWASHISLWKKCVSDHTPFLILEDNIELFGELVEQLKNIENLTKKYGLVKLGNIFERKHIEIVKIDEKYRLVSNLKGACGTSAYAITPKVAAAYLSQINGFFEPVDDFMDNEWRTRQTVYSYKPQLVSRSNTTSTIGQRKVKSNNGLLNKINIELYRLFKQLNQVIYNKRKKQ